MCYVPAWQVCEVFEAEAAHCLASSHVLTVQSGVICGCLCVDDRSCDTDSLDDWASGAR